MLKTHFSAYMRRVAFIITSNEHTLSLFLSSKEFLYLSDYECHKTPMLQPLPVWKSKVFLWFLLIPHLKSLYSNKWSLGCYAIKNVSLREWHLGHVTCSKKTSLAWTPSHGLTFIIRNGWQSFFPPENLDQLVKHFYLIIVPQSTDTKSLAQDIP